MNPDDLHRYRYTLDADDVIESVSPAWLAFARENGAPELTRDFVTGRSLWEFIDGEETRQLYRALLSRVRYEGGSMVVPFRCDSPTLRREMRLELRPSPDGHIQLDGILARAVPHRYFRLLDSEADRGGERLSMCSCCKRTLVESSGWLEVEEAVVRLHLLEGPTMPNIRNTVCPPCATAMSSAS